MEWTAAQKSAIETEGGNILVSAAAGSGKTAVLVERIIRRLLPPDGSKGIDIDRMLIVTFTEAAAAEMKEKIVSAISKSSHPDKRRQLRLCDRASITTIDAFCYRTVKNNFALLGIDPNFTIADKAQSELIKDEALDEVMEELYSKQNRRFYRLIDMYSSNRDDEALKGLIKRIYLFAQSFPEPQKWLMESVRRYRPQHMDECVYVTDILDRIRRAGKQYGEKFSILMREMIENTELEPRERYGLLYDDVQNGIEVCKRLCDDTLEWDEAHALYSGIFDTNDIYLKLNRRYSAIGNDESEKEEWREFYDVRSQLWKDFKDEIYSTAAYSHDELYKIFRALYTQAAQIAWLVNRFARVYKKKQERRNVMGFSDIEHLTYKLFKENESVRKTYRENFKAILIDEYQDTNELQDNIFSLIGEDNIFMVGDLKQSIYRFRGGDPTVFSSKSDRYRNNNGGTRIALSQNFRSRMEILDAVNDVFSMIMSKEAGEVEYTGDELLTRENDYYEENGCSHKAELHIIERIHSDEDEETAELSNEMAEAAFIAEKIRSLVDEGYKVRDKESGITRPIRYNDITILASSVKNLGETYISELSKRGINAYVETNGYFKRREIRLMLSLLKVINNHRLDIPLISVMRSPIGGFSDEELARIRYENPRTECFYDAVCLSAEKSPKCRAFTERLDIWRGYKKHKSVANMLWRLYEDTGFFDFMGALEGGEEAQLNLRLLYDRAKSYEESGFKGLFNFIRYIENISERSDDAGGAKVIGENHNVVRIMTIHKSKGLEFPVVFVAGCGARMKEAVSSRVVLHKDGGMGLMYVNAEESINIKTPASEYVKRANKKEEKSEAMRKLYVALTRPKEKLFVTGVISRDSEEKLDEYYKKCSETVKNGITPSAALGASTMLDWLLPAAQKSEKWEVEYSKPVIGDAAQEEEKKEEKVDLSLLEASVAKVLEGSYRFIESVGMPSKTSVTAIKQHQNEKSGRGYKGVNMTRRPELGEKRAISGAQLGTVYHKLMMCLDINTLPDDESVRAQIQKAVNDGVLSDDEALYVDAGYIVDYLKSPICARMKKSKKIYREAPFEIEIPVSVYDTDLKGGVYDDETILVQGIIDCFFTEEDGRAVLVDYKTDRCENTDEAKTEKKEEYATQLDIYARAIEKITGISVKEKYLYLFAVNDIV